jgi:uncharacterized protein (TIGR01777 family)
MRAVVAGSSGLIGTALVPALEASGYEVVRLVRRKARGADESEWHPERGLIDADLVKSADLVVNLAGASIGARRLTKSYAKVVLESRLETTGLLARTMAEAGRGHLIQASAMGYFGVRGEAELQERSHPGSGTLPEITIAWERAANPAELAGVSVQWLRTGLVLAATGGLAKRLLPLIRLGLVRSLGSGKQWMSWISLDDAVRAIVFLAASDHVGPVNVVAPLPARNAELIGALAHAAGRPRLFPVPAPILRLVVGPAADDLLGSQKATPGVLARLGFSFHHPDIDSAAMWVLGQARDA